MNPMRNLQEELNFRISTISRMPEDDYNNGYIQALKDTLKLIQTPEEKP
jgi:hypothetical protein